MHDKFGAVQRLNPPVWRLLSSNAQVCDDVEGVRLAFHQLPQASWQMANALQEEDIPKAAAVYAQYLHDQVIEEISAEDAKAGAIKLINGIIAVPKDEHEVRPCTDCSRSGLNECLTPYGM
jgi:hypothetical protein